VDEDEELRLRKTKDKRLKKHYSIKVGDIEVKIINYLFKRWTSKFEDIELIVLKSNIPFLGIDRGEVAIKINNEGKEVNVIGKYHHAVAATGTYDLAFSIIEKRVTSH
jgi:hypothetical protein